MISRETRLDIFRALQKEGSIWGNDSKEYAVNSHFSPLDFLSQIWDLRRMSSSDPRFTDAYQDAHQHLMNNDDWDEEYTFIDRFKLLDCGEEEFIKFLNVVLAPEVRSSERDIEKYSSIIEKYIPKDYSIIQVGERNGLKVLNVTPAHSVEDVFPIGVPENTIPFVVDKFPDEFPAFRIAMSSWDDYGYKTSCRLYYHDRKNNGSQEIGYVKILHDKEYDTRDNIPKLFKTLSTHFCSLGQSETYYYRLKSFFPDKYLSILYALKDAAFYYEIRERMEGIRGFKDSLLRNDEMTFILSAIKRKVERAGWADSWDFSFIAKLYDGKYQQEITVPFGNLEDEGNHHRVQALIGPNGAGKTTVLKSLVKQLISSEGEFKPNVPVFSKIIVISFSIFDVFINLRGKSVLNYVYCGLHNTESSIMSVDDRKQRLKIAIKRINEERNINVLNRRNRFRRFLNSLKIFFSEDWVESLYDDDGIRIDQLLSAAKNMSSGESMILNLVASLYANISQNTLIVFDELEVHLHPAAIRKMMTLLFKITSQYNSACLLATHSSIVVQELLADNVQIIERGEDGAPIVRALNHESLAENLSTISDDIFGESSISPYYVGFLKEIAESSDSLDEMLEKISSKNLPPSLRLYMVARNIFEKSCLL